MSEARSAGWGRPAKDRYYLLCGPYRHAREWRYQHPEVPSNRVRYVTEPHQLHGWSSANAEVVILVGFHSLRRADELWWMINHRGL